MGQIMDRFINSSCLVKGDNKSDNMSADLVNISHKTIYLKIADNSCFCFAFDNKSILNLTKTIRRNQNLEEFSIQLSNI